MMSQNSVNVLPSAVPSAPRAAKKPDLKAPATRTWPLALVLVAFPLTWLLGLSTAILYIACIPMVMDLRKRGRVQVPKGFGLWTLFLIIVLLSGFMLYADAPFAETGGSPLTDPFRILSWLVFSGYYVCATIVFLWVGNLSERELPTLTVVRMLGFLFAFSIVAGGLGTIAQETFLKDGIPSVIEFVMNKVGLGSLTKNSFIRDLIHPTLAQNMTIQQGGKAVYRAAAPFSYTNSWGSNTALLLPFFIYGWVVRGNRRTQILNGIFLLAAMGVIVLSLNRGMWLGIVLAAGLVTLRLTLQGKFIAIVAMAAALVVGGTLLAIQIGRAHV